MGPPNNFLFLENALKKTTEYFLKFFLFESTILPVNNGKIISFIWLPRLAMQQPTRSLQFSSTLSIS